MVVEYSYATRTGSITVNGITLAMVQLQVLYSFDMCNCHKSVCITQGGRRPLHLSSDHLYVGRIPGDSGCSSLPSQINTAGFVGCIDEVC